MGAGSPDLRAGETYEVIVTTAGGLWRYRLGDRVAVDGFVERTPSLRFLGRAGAVVDICGEKLSEAFVGSVIRCVTAASAPPVRFAMLAQEEDAGGRHYTLYLEGGCTPGLATRLDAGLCANPHYAWCRELGQLRIPEVFSIGSDAYARYAAAEVARGRRLGEIKPIALSPRSDWSRHFSPR
ncbi:MAG: GH3 auxin-responsive promoter family protein [Opitutaceae bacterium]|nr:GH3 auxin-responsive promoter family protein [Opitutaceae bacterium]